MSGEFSVQTFHPAPGLKPRADGHRLIPEEARLKFIQSFAPEIAKGAETWQGAAIVPPFEPVLVNFRRTGSSGVLALLRVFPPDRRPVLQVLCILLSGKDSKSDALAIEAVKSWTDNDGRPLRVDVTISERIGALRPLLVMSTGSV